MRSYKDHHFQVELPRLLSLETSKTLELLRLTNMVADKNFVPLSTAVTSLSYVTLLMEKQKYAPGHLPPAPPPWRPC